MDESHEPQEPDLEPGDLEPLEVTDERDGGEPEPEQEPDPAPAGRARNAILAGVAVVVIVGAAALGFHVANSGKASATLSTVTTPANAGGPTGSFRQAGRGPGAIGTIAAVNGSTLSGKGADGATTKGRTTASPPVTEPARP